MENPEALEPQRLLRGLRPMPLLLLLTWLLQRTGVFPVEHRRALGDRIYGCDDCQTVCPPNVRVGRRGLPADPRAVAWAPLLD